MSRVSVVMSDGVRMYTSGWKGGNAGKVAIGRRFIKMAESAEDPDSLALSYYLPDISYNVVIGIEYVRVSVMPPMSENKAPRIVTFDKIDWNSRIPNYIDDEQALSLFKYIFKRISG